MLVVGEHIVQLEAERAARHLEDPGEKLQHLLHPMVTPGVSYYLLTAAGIAAALGIIAATFPLLARITGPEVARNE